MGGGRGSEKKKKENKEEESFVTTTGGDDDARFASVHTDPRFANLSRHKAKVSIDSRFDRMFTDKSFSSSSAQIDKRGKLKVNYNDGNALKHYYRLEEEVIGKEEEDEDEEEKEEEEEEGSDESEEADSDEDDVAVGNDSTDEEDGVFLDDEEDTFVQDDNVPEIDKETRRLAVVNLDWGRVKAVDLYVLLSSFLLEGGHVLSVAVYPSDFGLQRMEEEAVHGPVGLFDDEKEKDDRDDDDDDDNDEIDNKKLRAYELSRLKYYYAVVECDSIATADYLYKTCDGVEFERSSNKLDLRFIPDSMEFKHPPRDVAKEAPADYEGLDFQTRALQLSKIDLTWDEDEPQHSKSLKRKFNADQLAELEVREFLASDESETDEDGGDALADPSEKKHKKMDKYRALLQSGEGSDENNDDEGQDMEVTFNTGLEDLSKRILEKKDTKSETVWDQHLRKMKEKKKARRNRSKESSDDESDDDEDVPAEEIDDFFIDESSFKEDKKNKGKSKQKGKKNQEVDKEAEEKSRAELELLLADENGTEAGLKGYNLKRRKVKGKKGKEILDEGKIPTIDYEDPRFSSLFKSPLFALDPTDPQFKRSAAYARQLAEKQRTGDQEGLSTKGQRKFDRAAEVECDVGEMDKIKKKDKHELSSLVKSIKMKSKQAQLPPSGKVIRKSCNIKI